VFAIYWGRALALTTLLGAVLTTIVLGVSRFALPHEIPSLLVFLVAISDILGLNVITQCGQAFQAFEKLQWTSGINVMMSAGRLAGALILISVHSHPSALQWGYVYLGSTAFVTAISVVLVLLQLGRPRLEWKSLRTEMREGFYFSSAQTSQTIYNDIDKTMLARLSTLDAAGVYGAAYRLIDVSFVPVSAALWSAYPSFFRAGVSGIAGSLKFARPLMLRAFLYSGVVCLLILLCAGLVPHVLGPEYLATAEALRWLSVLPVLKALHYFFADTLTSSGHQGTRTAIQAGVAVFNVLINLWIIPAYSWRGAAWSSVASDGLLLAGVGLAVRLIARAELRSKSGTSAEINGERLRPITARSSFEETPVTAE
jgi:O-antigen/teichoic acid export membrane protein